MGETTSGIRSMLSLAGVYDVVQNALGAEHYRREIAQSYLRSLSPQRLRILDVGCGTAQILRHLPECTYVGVDFSERYISAARKRYGDRGSFVCAEATQASFQQWIGQFDCVVMLGLLHHLEDAEVVALFRAVGPALAADGRLFAVDPTVAPDTHAVGRFLASRDRGRNVRPPHGYQELARLAYRDVTLHVRHDLLRVPYSHAVLECSRPLGQDDE